MKSLYERNLLFSVTELKERGWTKVGIERFLGEPDDIRDNPHYKSGAPTQFFLKARVKRKEKTKGWIAWAEGSKSRSESSLAGVETKTDKLLEYVEGLTIEVPVLDDQTLRRRAAESYNNLWAGRRGGEEKRASPSDDGEFMDRICVNYLRHQLTSYEAHLDKIAGKVGKTLAHSQLRSLFSFN